MTPGKLYLAATGAPSPACVQVGARRFASLHGDETFALEPGSGRQPTQRVAGLHDDGGGGGGGGGGFVSIACAGDVFLGLLDEGDPGDPDDDVIRVAVIRAVGGRGGSTYTTPAPASPADDKGQGEAGGESSDSCAHRGRE